MFLKERKVNGSLVFKKKTEKLLLIHPLHTVNISFIYLMRLYSKYNVLYFGLPCNMDMLEETCYKKDLLLFLEYYLNHMPL